MLAKVHSAAVLGIDSYPIEIEVNRGWGQPAVIIVGLPDAAVKESRDRVKTAIENSGFKYVLGRTTINLAPADVKKEGPSFDLPIAIGILAVNEQIVAPNLDEFTIVGELALGGEVRSVNGVLPIAICAREQKKRGLMFRPTTHPKRRWSRASTCIPPGTCARWRSFSRANASCTRFVKIHRRFSSNSAVTTSTSLM